MKVVVGSESNRKIQIAKRIFELLTKKKIEIAGCSTDSGVPNTPYDKQTYEGSLNRATGAKKLKPESDYWVGLESGLIERYGHIYEEAWATIISREGSVYSGYSSGLKVPDYILKRMDDLKMEHCEVMTVIEKEFGKLPNDTWGTYTGSVILREISLEEALRNALIQITAPENSMFKR